uniref:TLC domain-containing protein n=1 Tax=Corethron hystrix TaxID=216773 RepID=A0A7S1FY69_9STRA|mmetsp:Transcript_38534/g.89579  ORF Transcript_38534/g.89579 Transcript_38534/m.89579 type:complete len:268 (+) Transcript_38534:272-1075(+)
MFSPSSVDVWFPSEFIRKALADICLYTLAIFFYNGIIWHILSFKLSGKTSTNITQASYRLVNFTVNFGFSFFGIYYWYFQMEELHGWGRIVYSNLSLFAHWQLAYQLWAIPMGLITEESQLMMLHHLGVISASISPAFCTMGMRYESVYFLGVIEVSSVFLAVMNYFKDNPELIKMHPMVYSSTRLIFAVLFIVIRVIFFFPNLYIYLEGLSTIYSARKDIDQMILVLMGVTSAVMLGLMQIFWAYLILKGLAKMLFGRGGNGGKNK